MSEAAPAGLTRWLVRRAVWFLVACHLPFVIFPPFEITTRTPGMSVTVKVLFVLIGVAAGGLQLRHSLAAARGERPRAWPWTYAAVLALAYVPLWWQFSYDWLLVIEWFVITSTAMLMRGRLAVFIVAVLLIGTPVVENFHDHTVSYPRALIFTCYDMVVLVMGCAALYGSARLVGILEGMFAARTELAEQALAGERFRVSRDLHDLLGQSLSAVSLKGDLAMRLLAFDTGAARREIEGLTSVARAALRDMRAVARDEHEVSLKAEIESAAGILNAAGIQTQVTVELPELSLALDAVLAWAIREGVTNILRHSEARTCSIAAERANGLVRLEIVNDGAQGARGAGSGLAGLADRARALQGSAANEHLDHGEFRLRVELPENTT
jgi:two-component system, NarL family, sensor histidine kinase DesK